VYKESFETSRELQRMETENDTRKKEKKETENETQINHASMNTSLQSAILFTKHKNK
jgi:hypothetical protein